jgi:hypothetical protein
LRVRNHKKLETVIKNGMAIAIQEKMM